MTTQVGTIAFMAPELLSRIHIEPSMKGRRREKKQNENGYELMTEMEEMRQNERKWSTHSAYSEHINHRTLNGRKLFASLQNILSSPNNANHAHKTNKYKFKYMANGGGSGDSLTTIYDKSVDIFSFGIIMFEIGFLRRVYEEMSIEEIYQMVTNDELMSIQSYEECQRDKQNGFYVVSDAVYEKYVELMRQCQHYKPEKRLSFVQIKQKLLEIEAINHNF